MPRLGVPIACDSHDQSIATDLRREMAAVAEGWLVALTTSEWSTLSGCARTVPRISRPVDLSAKFKPAC
jgi:hypothetical protein